MISFQKNLLISSILSTCIILFSACESSSSQGVSRFVDSAVSGLEYRCSSGNGGVTNDLGEFTCEDNNSVEFLLGDTSLGEVNVTKLMTPYSLFQGDEQSAINLAQLLQTLDRDANLSNGIDIDDEILATLPILNFNSASFDEEAQLALGERALVKEVHAQEHLDDTLLSYDFVTSKKGSKNSIIYKLFDKSLTAPVLAPIVGTMTIIDAKEVYTLKDVNYTISKSKVTKDKDPDGNLNAGKSYALKDGEFVFYVDRSQSSEVADWWVENIQASQSTYNDAPTKLNFAMIGTMKMDIKQSAQGWTPSNPPFTFDQTALAQVHNGLYNNWIYGGSDCEWEKSYISDKVVCRGEDANGEEVKMAFFKSETHTIDFMPLNLSNAYDTSRWMSLLDKTTTLNDIVMPGSHDAGMSILQGCYGLDNGIGKNITKTQSLNIGKQLEAGSRYFDVRLDTHDGELYTYHGDSTGGGCHGESLISVLNGVVAFLEQNPTETAILAFPKPKNDDDGTAENFETLLDKYSAYLYKDSQNKYEGNLAKLPLSDVAGKFIAVFNYDDYKDPSNGRFYLLNGEVKTDDNTQDCSGDDPKDCECKYIDGSNLSVCNNYSNKTTYEKMVPNQLYAWENFASLEEEQLFLLSWTVTGSAWNALASSGAVEVHAMKANYKLPAILYEKIVEEGYAKPNIVYVDFMEKGVAQNIIQWNFK